jgi:hypothetical protein
MSAVSAASDHLFERFCRELPLQVPGARARSTTQVETALQRFYAEARAQREERRLGIIGRARVAFALQQRLLKAGYPAGLVRQVLFALLAVAFSG